MKYRIFTFKNDELLCWRLGPINSIKQKHFNKEVTVNGLGGNHKPPISRGMWAFPYPHYDLFFCYHRWTTLLPKKFQKDDQEHDESYWEEKEKLMKQIINNNKPSTFYASGFYSHIFPNGNADYNSWFYWDCARDWAKEATKHLIMIDRSEHGVYKWRYAKDHLELFVP